MTLTGRTRRLVSVFLAVVALASLTLMSAAAFGGLNDPPKTRQFSAHLNGYQETPSISSTGWGEFRATLVDETTIHYVFTYGGLEGGNSLFAHVHFGGRSMAGGVSFFLCGGTPNPMPARTSKGRSKATSHRLTSWGPTLRASRLARSPRSCVRCAPGRRTRTSTPHGGRAARFSGQINDPDQKQYER